MFLMSLMEQNDSYAMILLLFIQPTRQPCADPSFVPISYLCILKRKEVVGKGRNMLSTITSSRPLTGKTLIKVLACVSC